MATATPHYGELMDDHEYTQQIESPTTLMALNASEIDTQISTAKKYPRSIKRFQNEALEMVTLSEDIAGDCIYALPRQGKSIEGPSARFAEIMVSAWGNCRAGARVVSEDERFVTSQGVFLDLQRNTAITYEVKRRITDKYGNRYKDDMVGVTSNAACSIALRNAVLKGIPKAFWKNLYDAARRTAIGNVKTLASRRAAMLLEFGKMGVTPEVIFQKLDIAGEEDITLDHMALLRGMFTTLRDGESTVEQLFSPDTPPTSSKVRTSKLNEKLGDMPSGETEPVEVPESLKAYVDAIHVAGTFDAVTAAFEQHVNANSGLSESDYEAGCRIRDWKLDQLEQRDREKAARNSKGKSNGKGKDGELFDASEDYK